MINFRMRQIPAMILTGATILSISPAQVTAEELLVLEEILVTARKRAESIQDTPLAVSALSGADLMDAGITNLADITELVPNLQVTRPSRDASVYIRGVGPARGATNVTELGVGVYIDDVFLLKPQGQLIDLAEIQSVQVLRGPQGTLFGKNTVGGAMIVDTVKPSVEFGGYGQVTAGNDGRLNVQASVDVPLSESLLTKFTVTSVQADGIDQDPVTGDELSDEDRIGGLLQLRWLASDNVTADFSIYHNRIRENPLAQGDCVVTNPQAQIPGGRLVTPITGFDLITDFCERASDGAASYVFNEVAYDLDATQVSANVAWDINENHSLKSITAWRNQETPATNYTNAFAGYPGGEKSFEDGDSTQITQEFQFTGDLLDGSVRYTTGLFFMRDESDTGSVGVWTGANGVWGSIAEAIPTGLVAALANYDLQSQDNENDTYAIYTQWSWDLTEQLEITAGLRYGYEKRDQENVRSSALPPWEAYANVPGAIIIPGQAALFPYPVFFDESLAAEPPALGDPVLLEADESYESLTPMLSVAYNFSEEALHENINGLMMYASYTEGYKAGGFSDFGLGELLPFEEENLQSVELGVKLDAWNSRFRLNAALFSMDYDDMQLFVARPDPDPQVIQTYQGVTNAGKSSIDGLELELSVVPAADWLINFSASFADGSFDEFEDFAVNPETGLVITLDRSDEDLPSLPETSFSLGVQYDWDTSFGAWTARVDAFYRDEMYWGFDYLTWQIPLARKEATTDSYTTFNARLNWQVSDGLSLTAWGKNLTDETYYDGGTGEAASLGHVIKSFAAPRRYGIDIRYDF